MKFRTTQKAIKAGFADVVCVPYCALQNLLRYESPIAYTVRREGWGADIYSFGAKAIVTGYAPFGNVRPDYEVVQKYDNMARGVFDRNQLDEMIEQFQEEVC